MNQVRSITKLGAEKLIFELTGLDQLEFIKNITDNYGKQSVILHVPFCSIDNCALTVKNKSSLLIIIRSIVGLICIELQTILAKSYLRILNAKVHLKVVEIMQ